MKALFFYSTFALLLLTTLPSVAQTEKGTKLLGGNGNISLMSGTFNGSLNPNLGLFISDNFALGISLPLYYSGNNDNSTKATGLSPFARYYFGEGSTRIFASAALGYTHIWYSYSENSTHSSGHVRSSAGLGLVHFLTNQVGMEAILSYGGIHRSENHTGILQLNLGFQIFLPSSK